MAAGKNRLRAFARGNLLGSVAIAALIGTTLAGAPHAFAADDGDAIETVTVTALKRGTNIQKTPESMTAVSADTLSTYGKVEVSDLAGLVPSLSYTNANANMQIFIRGVGQTILQPGGEPGVAFYSDGVYIADVTSANVAFMDIDRVEILRGPQGALYGRNAVGGAVTVVTAAPTSQFSSSARATLGNYGRADFSGFLSGPLGDAGVDGRLSFQIEHNNGFMKNLNAGTPGAPDRVNQTDTQAARLQFAIPVGANGKLRLIANYAHEDDNGPTSKILPESFAQPAELLYGLKPTSDPNAVESNYSKFRRKVWSFTGNYTQAIGSTVLTMIADTRGSSTIFGYDLDGTPAPVFLLKNDAFSSWQSSAETYLAGGSGTRFQWLVGASYLKIKQNSAVIVPGQYPLGFLTGDPAQNNIPFPATINVGGVVKTTSWAGYGDGTFAITDWLKLRGGVRYNVDKKTAIERLSFAGFANTAPNRGKWSEWTGKGGLELTPNDDTLVYVTFSRGYKAGAINLGAFQAPVDPEFVNNYEAGAKYTSPDHRLLLNGNVFLAKYTNMQVTQVGALNSVLTNAGKSTIKGVEIEATAVPLDELQISANLSYLDAQFDKFKTADLRLGGTPVDAAGHPLPMVSKWQFTLRGQYGIPLESGARIQLNADYAWRSRFNFSEFVDPLRSQGSYGMLDIAASWQSPDRHWRVFGIVRNLTDARAIESLNIVSPLLGTARVADYFPPRNFGIGVEFTY